MALIQFEFKSEVLALACQINVVLSQRIAGQFGSNHKSPALYLLHGLSDDHSGWLRKSSIERYAEDYDVMIVMPGVHRSFYRNTYSGYRYFDYLADELPSICSRYFPISNKAEDRFVAGLSMGGYGAFKLALSRPENYAAAASLSGCLDLNAVRALRDEMYPEWPHIFGPEDRPVDERDDLLQLASKRVAEGSGGPRLFQCCGTEDYLYGSNQNFLKHARSIGLEVDYSEGPGEHEWKYWDSEIQNVLKWLNLQAIEKPEPRPSTAESKK